MKITLNNYTIDDFLKLKPIIYEYCLNLTQKKTSTSWFRDLADANDLYQEVFLYVYDNYFNKPKDACSEGKFIQIMRNCTYWTYHRRFTRANSKLYRNLNRIDDSSKDFYIFDNLNVELPSYYSNFKESIDYNFYISKLNSLEVKMIEMYLDGYLIKEIDEYANKYKGYFENVVRKKLKRFIDKDCKKPRKPIEIVVEKQINDIEFLKSKFANYENIFNFKRANDKFIKMYSLYLQKKGIQHIAKQLNIPPHQVSVEIFRIKQKIKKYGSSI